MFLLDSDIEGVKEVVVYLVAFTVMFHLRRIDMKAYWKKTNKDVGDIFQVYVYLC